MHVFLVSLVTRLHWDGNEKSRLVNCMFSFLSLVMSLHWGVGKGKSRLVNCMFSFLSLVTRLNWDGKGKSRLVNCIFSFVSLVMGLGWNELGRLDHTIAVLFCNASQTYID